MARRSNDQGWNGRLTATVGAELRRWRKHARMSAQALADATAELGHPMPRNVIVNMENGRRADVPIADLLVLGRALGIAPALLVFPLGRVDAQEVLPGASATPWDSLRWFVGRGPAPDAEAASRQVDWDAGTAPVVLYQQHQDEVDQWAQAPARAFLLGDSEAHTVLRSMRADAETRLVALRGTMLKLGLTPPSLDPVLAVAIDAMPKPPIYGMFEFVHDDGSTERVCQDMHTYDGVRRLGSDRWTLLATGDDALKIASGDA